MPGLCSEPWDCWSMELPEPLRPQNIRGPLADEEIEEKMLNFMNSYCGSAGFSGCETTQGRHWSPAFPSPPYHAQCPALFLGPEAPSGSINLRVPLRCCCNMRILTPPKSTISQCLAFTFLSSPSSNSSSDRTLEVKFQQKSYLRERKRPPPSWGVCISKRSLPGLPGGRKLCAAG